MSKVLNADHLDCRRLCQQHCTEDNREERLQYCNNIPAQLTISQSVDDTFR